MAESLWDIIIGKDPMRKHADRECACWHSSVVNGTLCRPGFVYIVRFGDLYKIGATDGNKGINSIKARIAAINKQVGQKGGLVGFIQTNCAQGFEHWLHREYRAQCVRTEFFRLHDTEIQTIRALDAFNGAPLHFFSTFSEYPNMQNVK